MTCKAISFRPVTRMRLSESLAEIAHGAALSTGIGNTDDEC